MEEEEGQINTYLELRRSHVTDAQRDRWFSETVDSPEELTPEVIHRINLLPGPLVLPSVGRGGYGLFAERDYEPREFITRYEGIHGGPHAEGPYVVYNSYTRETVDGAYGFPLLAKGRWINEYAADTRQRRAHVNCRLEYHPEGRYIYFRTIGRVVRKGEEFFWDYGRDYDRSGYVQQELPCSVCARAPSSIYVTPQDVLVCDGCVQKIEK